METDVNFGSSLEDNIGTLEGGFTCLKKMFSDAAEYIELWHQIIFQKTPVFQVH